MSKTFYPRNWELSCGPSLALRSWYPLMARWMLFWAVVTVLPWPTASGSWWPAPSPPNPPPSRHSLALKLPTRRSHTTFSLFSLVSRQIGPSAIPFFSILHYMFLPAYIFFYLFIFCTSQNSTQNLRPNLMPLLSWNLLWSTRTNKIFAHLDLL